MSLNAKNTLNNTINLNNLSVVLTFTISQKKSWILVMIKKSWILVKREFKCMRESVTNI